MFACDGVDSGKLLISFVSKLETEGAGTSVPSHLTDDLIVVSAWNVNNSTVPSLASDYTSITTYSGSGWAVRLGYKFATSSSEPPRTWTNASNVFTVVYRNVGSIGTAQTDTGNGPTLTYAGGTLDETDGSSWLLAMAAGEGDYITGLNTPTGYTERHEGFASFFDNDFVTSWSSATAAMGGGQQWFTVVIEMLAAE